MELRATVATQTSQNGQAAAAVPDPIAIRDVLGVCYKLTQYGVLRFAGYCGADLPQLSLDATLWVGDRLPLRADLPTGTVKRIASEVVARHIGLQAANGAE